MADDRRPTPGDRLVYDWSVENGVDLENRLRYGVALTSSEITRFCQYIRAGRGAPNVISTIARHKAAPNPSTVNRMLNWVKASFRGPTSPSGAWSSSQSPSLLGRPRAYSDGKSSLKAFQRRKRAFPRWE